MDKTAISLKIKSYLKNLLEKLSDQDGRSETYHLERALINYFKAKKLLNI